MTPQSSRTRFSGRIHNSCGKANFGCIFSIALLGMAIFVAIRMAPPWFSYKGLESDVKAEAARAGAHFLTDESIVKEIVYIAEKNDVRLAKDDIEIRRFADQLEITIQYTVPIDLLVYQWNWEFEMKTSSYVGRL